MLLKLKGGVRVGHFSKSGSLGKCLNQDLEDLPDLQDTKNSN